MQGNQFKNVFYIFFIFGYLFFCFTSCKGKYERTQNIISEFKIQDYKFEVYHVIKKERKTGITIKEYNDTVLVNICDFYEDFEDCEDGKDVFYRR